MAVTLQALADNASLAQVVAQANLLSTEYNRQQLYLEKLDGEVRGYVAKHMTQHDEIDVRVNTLSANVADLKVEARGS